MYVEGRVMVFSFWLIPKRNTSKCNGRDAASSSFLLFLFLLLLFRTI